jgi:hypothetical protein
LKVKARNGKILRMEKEGDGQRARPEPTANGAARYLAGVLGQRRRSGFFPVNTGKVGPAFYYSNDSLDPFPTTLPQEDKSVPVEPEETPEGDNSSSSGE